MATQFQISPELLKHGKPITCKKCHKDVFVNRVRVLKISRLLPENKIGKDFIIDVPVKQCASCKRVLTPEDVNDSPSPTVQ